LSSRGLVESATLADTQPRLEQAGERAQRGAWRGTDPVGSCLGKSQLGWPSTRRPWPR